MHTPGICRGARMIRIAGPNPPRNLKGGFKCDLSLPWPRKRHDGVRCYGNHVNGRCYPYDFSREPSVQQSSLAPKKGED